MTYSRHLPRHPNLPKRHPVHPPEAFAASHQDVIRFDVQMYEAQGMPQAMEGATQGGYARGCQGYRAERLRWGRKQRLSVVSDLIPVECNP